MELVHEREIALIDDRGTPYDRVRVYAAPQAGGTWAGILEFVPVAEGSAVRTDRETTQSNREFVTYWATGLEPIYFEGALERATRSSRSSARKTA